MVNSGLSKPWPKQLHEIIAVTGTLPSGERISLIPKVSPHPYEEFGRERSNVTLSDLFYYLHEALYAHPQPVALPLIPKLHLWAMNQGNGMLKFTIKRADLETTLKTTTICASYENKSAAAVWEKFVRGSELVEGLPTDLAAPWMVTSMNFYPQDIMDGLQGIGPKGYQTLLEVIDLQRSGKATAAAVASRMIGAIRSGEIETTDAFNRLTYPQSFNRGIAWAWIGFIRFHLPTTDNPPLGLFPFEES